MKVGGAKVMMLVLAVLVAAGIFNTLFVSVMERLREFGIMLAVGFSPGQLFRLVMLESVWLAAIGLTAAAAVTIGPYLYLASTGIDISGMIPADQMEVAGVGMSTVMQVGIYGESVALIGVSALVAILLSGVYPAWRAGQADPVETIRLV
jgi:ABC-type antimicrobial peptide transport system permease subunit